MSRRSATSGQTRPIDPSAWFPVGAPARCRFALILFSHGASGRATDYSRLLTHLASEGFVVVAPHHPDRLTRGDRAVDRNDDVIYLIDHLHVVADRLSPGMWARLDRARIGIAGHSFGAFTAAQLAATDGRIRAALVMAGGTRDRAAARTRVPVLAMAGGADRLVPAAQVAAYVRRLPASTPHGFLEIGRAGHGAYGNGCAGRSQTCRIVASYATSFFLAYLEGIKSAGRLLDSHAPRDARLSLRTVGMPPR